MTQPDPRQPLKTPTVTAEDLAESGVDLRAILTKAAEKAAWDAVPDPVVVAHQWSVRYPDGFVDGGRFTEAGAQQRAAELGGEVVYRAVGPWINAEEPA